ncbi:hypothetical protein [Paenibacillus xylanivorans]|uniref:Uncharacterized protein n=1 Tax=Paenibacillus xylanivorans TaxID=1705561 RepID=A0A0M9BT79_9BACL|nr:hypothetical protein [Paenibacillus xylanivorans]KOY17856.1 hypothetical protein AMS66_03760 [Paenibacillus xylanivorans]
MKNRKYQKQRKKYVNQLIDIIENSTEYQDYIDLDERYKRFVKSKALLKVWGFSILDTYDNKAMNRLIKRISKLNMEKYQVTLNYRPKKIRDLNYFTLQYVGSSQSSLAKIEFLDDRFIREITVSFSQVNNNQAVVEFKISFNKIMDDKMFLDFIKNNKESVYNKKFIDYYNLDNLINTRDFSEIYRMFNELVGLMVQSKLMEIAELNYGLLYKLPSLKVINYPKNVFDQEAFKDVFLSTTYEIRNGEQYLITDMTRSDGLEMELYFTGRTYSPLTFTSILSIYRMDFYYFLFDRIEESELNQKMNKYFNQAKDNITSKDYKWLVNKIRAINDNKLHMSSQKNDRSEIREWKAFYGGEEIELYFANNKYIEKYKTIYSECLDHIKVLYSVGKESLIINIAILTLVATLLGIGVTVLMTFL